MCQSFPSALDAAEASGKPFFLWSSFQDPHNPCMVPEPWASMYDPADMPAYGPREGEFDDKPPFYAGAQQAGPLGHPQLDEHKNWYCFKGLEQMDAQATRQLCAYYYGMVSLMDHHIGRIFKAMDERGLWESTIVVFTTDHGDYLGNHGLWWKGLPTYEDMQRLPFVVRHPRCKTPGARSQAFQSLVDIGATACAGARVAPPAGLQGVDQTAAWTDAAQSARDWAMVEYRPTESPFMQKTFLHGRWKLVVYHDLAYGELYDLEADPDQYENLWDKSELAQARLELLRRCIAAEMEKDGHLRPREAWA